MVAWKIKQLLSKKNWYGQRGILYNDKKGLNLEQSSIAWSKKTDKSINFDGNLNSSHKLIQLLGIKYIKLNTTVNQQDLTDVYMEYYFHL